MRSFIKDDLGCKALVTGTVVFGPCGLYAQSGMDYVDTHAYWQHPKFPGRPWDPDNWIVEQKAMVDHPDESPLFGLAASRLAGKPFTVSEYNHPAPNDYQAECVPMIASFAAAQDWDGLWLFTYSHGTDDWDRKHFAGFFDIDANPAKWGFVPAGAAIFRHGALGSLSEERIVCLSPSGDVLGDLIRLHVRHGRNLLSSAAQLEGAAAEERKPRDSSGTTELPPDRLTNREMVLLRRVAVALEGKSRSTHPKTDQLERPLLLWTGAGQDARGNFEVLGGGVTVLVGPHMYDRVTRLSIHEPDFSMLVVVPLDEKRLLVTACGRCENTGMKFSQDRRTVGRNWGGPPTRIQPVAGGWQFSKEGKWRCHALGPDGRALAEVPLVPLEEEGNEGLSTVEFSPKYKTMWYLLTREEGKK